MTAYFIFNSSYKQKKFNLILSCLVSCFIDSGLDKARESQRILKKVNFGSILSYEFWILSDYRFTFL